MFDPIFLIPAYGREYVYEEEAVNDWNNGKDFKIVNGPYCSIRDITELKKQYGCVYIAWSLNEAIMI